MNITYRNFEIEKDWTWFTNTLPVFLVEDTHGLVAMDGDEVAAAWVLDNYTGASVQCHMVIYKPMCMRYGVLQTMAGILFDALNCNAVYALVPSTNEKALKINTHFGFVEAARLKGAYLNADSVVLEMTRETCRYYVPQEEVRYG